VVEGPITNISDNVITIYGFDIEVEPEHPILKLIETGEVVRVQGTLRNDGDLVATVISNNLDTSDTDSTLATVKLEGPVEAVSGSSITVNGILVQLNADDALLQTIQVGNFVSVEGNFQSENAVIVLTVVNIAVIGTTAPEAESACWYHDNAMGMGHWHCDGMGMGDAMGPDMGMGMGPDMGMGPAMGMEN
jgi:hypothetical protein